MKKMSKEAWRALLAAQPRTGAPVYARGEARKELQDNGMVGVGGGLTDTGRQARSAEMTRRLDEAFG